MMRLLEWIAGLGMKHTSEEWDAIAVIRDTVICIVVCYGIVALLCWMA